MLNYTNLLYQCIGLRLKKHLKNQKISQRDFAEQIASEGNISFDPSFISRIAKGTAYTKKNPHLLSQEKMIAFAKCMNISTEQLIWGDNEDKERFIKLILLAILMNNDKLNPIIGYEHYEELFIWAKTQNCLPHDLHLYVSGVVNLFEDKYKIFFLETGREMNKNEKEELRNRIKESYITLGGTHDRKDIVDSTGKIDSKKESEMGEKEIGVYPSMKVCEIELRLIHFFKEKYGFFFSNENAKLYDSLNNSFDKELEGLSNIILAQLKQDFYFAQSFILRLSNYIWNSNFDKQDNYNDILDDLEKYLLNFGQYGSLILDWKGYDYHLFVNAFNKFWKKKEQQYFSIFDNYFFKNSALEQSGLKAFKNDFFDKIIKSKEFRSVKAAFLDEYTDPESYLAKKCEEYYIEDLIWKCMIENNSDEPFFDYFVQSSLKKIESTAQKLNLI